MGCLVLITQSLAQIRTRWLCVAYPVIISFFIKNLILQRAFVYKYTEKYRITIEHTIYSSMQNNINLKFSLVGGSKPICTFDFARLIPIPSRKWYNKTSKLQSSQARMINARKTAAAHQDLSSEGQFRSTIRKMDSRIF